MDRRLAVIRALRGALEEAAPLSVIRALRAALGVAARCQDCGATFASMAALWDHRQQAHGAWIDPWPECRDARCIARRELVGKS